MNLRARLTWIGLALLAGSLFVPRIYAVAGAELAAVVLGVGLVEQLFARARLRTLMAIARGLLLAVAAAILFDARYLFEQDTRELVMLAFLSGIAATGLVILAVEGRLSNRWKSLCDVTWAMALTGCCVAFVLTALHRSHVVSFAGVCVPAMVFGRKKRNRGNGLRLETIVRKAQAAAQRRQPTLDAQPSRRPKVGPFGRQRVYVALSALAWDHLEPDVRYARMKAVCLRHPQVDLAAKLLYVAATARADWETANSIACQAAKYGLEIGPARSELLPEVAERLGPRWREILREDDLRTVLTQSTATSEIDEWRRDPSFAYFESAFVPSGAS